MIGRSPFSSAADHLRVKVRLTPKAASDQIAGMVVLSDGTEVLAARVRAVPDSDRASAALEKLLAAALGVPRSTVRVTAGRKARLKQLRIDGDPAALLDLARRLWPL